MCSAIHGHRTFVRAHARTFATPGIRNSVRAICRAINPGSWSVLPYPLTNVTDSSTIPSDAVPCRPQKRPAALALCWFFVEGGRQPAGHRKRNDNQLRTRSWRWRRGKTEEEEKVRLFIFCSTSPKHPRLLTNALRLLTTAQDGNEGESESRVRRRRLSLSPLPERCPGLCPKRRAFFPQLPVQDRRRPKVQGDKRVEALPFPYQYQGMECR